MQSKQKSTRPLGKLEEKVMAILWRDGPLSVREVNKSLGEKSLAHTTVMTTLDRLFKKGLLTRTKDGVAFIYEPALSRDEYRQLLVGSTVTDLLAEGTNAEPVLAAFVDAAAEIDEENLAKLETLISARKKVGD